MTLVGAVRISLHGDKDVGRRVGTEPGWQNADERVWLAAQHDGGAQQSGAAPQPCFPKVVAHDGGPGAAGKILLKEKIAAHGGLGSEDPEVALGHVNALDLLGTVARAEVQ